MPELDWHRCVDILRPHVAKVSTPRGHGTGFYFSRAAGGNLNVVATAAHVVKEAAEWEEPIRVQTSDHRAFLRPTERAIIQREKSDTAAIVFASADRMFPAEPLTLIDERKAARVGVDIGWLGFPSVAPDELCFFLGRISAQLPTTRSYLVDGVAINGVSGGPAFGRLPDGSILLVGILSAYLPNMAASMGALPGLCMVRHVGGLHEIARELKSLEDAKEKEEKEKGKVGADTAAVESDKKTEEPPR